MRPMIHDDEIGANRPLMYNDVKAVSQVGGTQETIRGNLVT